MIEAEKLKEYVLDRWSAGHQVLVLRGDESYRYQVAIEEAGEIIAEKLKKNDRTFHIYCHDKVCGFYRSEPLTLIGKSPSSSALVALQAMMCDSTDTLDKAGAFFDGDDGKELLWHPENDVIFILKDWDDALTKEPKVVQYLRNIIASNKCSANSDTGRGQRMLIMISPVATIPNTLPELHPEDVPLPEGDILRRAVDVVIESAGLGKKVDDEARNTVTSRLHGLTYQAAEDTMALAVQVHQGWKMPDMLDTIDGELARHIANIPGLTCVSKKQIARYGELAGYERAEEFVNSFIDIPRNLAAQHGMKPLRGMAIAGTPGTGKTVFGVRLAQLLDRMLLIWSIGESQNKYVGDSEANARRVIQVAQATRALVLLDDIDKAGTMAAATGNDGSGVMGRIVQMLLTEMSSPDNEATWCFTMNRLAGIPPELIRPGRVDGQFFVERPDAVTRAKILRLHIDRRNFGMDDKHIVKIASDVHTSQWAGAELEGLVEATGRQALLTRTDKLDAAWMIERLKQTKPMAKQAIYQQDFQAMESALDAWIRVGRSPQSDKTPATNKGPRRKRSMTPSDGTIN